MLPYGSKDRRLKFGMGGVYFWILEEMGLPCYLQLLLLSPRHPCLVVASPGCGLSCFETVSCVAHASPVPGLTRYYQPFR